MNGLSLFSGIGGIDLALSEWVRPILYCENERYSQAVLLSRMSDGQLARAPIWDDVCSLRGDELAGQVDIVYGGFPCQDLSAAGAGAGLAGERSGLYFEIERIVREAKPTFVFLENVPAIRTRGLGRVVWGLAELGYGLRWTTVSAAEVGAPHVRKRWFLLAHAHGHGTERGKQFTKSGESTGNVADPARELSHGCGPRAEQNRRGEFADAGWWAVEPDVGGTLDGLSAWLDKAGEMGETMAQRIIVYAAEAEKRPEEILQALRKGFGAQEVQWASGGPRHIPPQDVLQSCLLRIEKRSFDQARLQLARKAAPEAFLRGVWNEEKPSRSPRRSEQSEQSTREHPDSLQTLSRLLALDAEEAWSAYRWQDAETTLSNWKTGWESGFARVAHGIPFAVDRDRGLGNAVVPAQAREAFMRLAGLT